MDWRDAAKKSTVKSHNWQIPVRLVFAGTVRRALGVTLFRAVAGCRSPYWEHGQLYVALSGVRNPYDLCTVLPVDLVHPEIKIPVDQDGLLTV
jgi:hypothetical protein